MRVRVARIGKPFGLAGDVTVQVFTDEPEARFAVGSELVMADHDGADALRVDRVRGQGQRWTLGLVGIDDRTAAEALRGTELYADVPTDARPDGSADEWYDRQLIGLPALSPAGESLGEVVGVEHPPAHDLLLVRTGSGHVGRVPFVSGIVTEVTPGGVVIDPPGGLLTPDDE
jgi:16S rRNA processing protein RimM